MDIQPVSGASPLAVTAGAAGAQLTDGQIVAGKVLAVGPKGVQLAIDGRVVTVQSEIPLAVGDQLALQVSRGGAGQVRLTMLSLQGSATSLLSDSNIGALLSEVGLPSDPPYRDAARTLLSEAGNVDRSAVQTLMRQVPGDRPAAAFLLARGLPVTPAAIALVKTGEPSATFGQQLAGPLSEAIARADSPPELLNLALPPGADARTLTQALSTLAEVFTPPEALLARHLARSRRPPDLQAPEAPEPAASELPAEPGASPADPSPSQAPPPALSVPTGEPESPMPPAGAPGPAAVPSGGSAASPGTPAAPPAALAVPPGLDPTRPAPAAPGSGPSAEPATQAPPPPSVPPAPLPADPPGPPAALIPQGPVPQTPPVNFPAPPPEKAAQGDRGASQEPDVPTPGGAEDDELAREVASNLIVALARAIARQAADAQDAQDGRTARAKNPAPQPPPPKSPSPLADLQQRIRYQQLTDAAAADGQAASAEVRLPLLLGAHRGELVIQHWKGNVKDREGHSRVVLALDMAKLGPLKVDLMYARGHVNGTLTVSDPATAAYLKDRIPELSSSLSGIGIGVGHLGVTTPSETASPAPTGARFDLRL